MTILGVDVGTTRCKAVVVTPDGTVVGSADREYPLRTPAPGWAELDASEVWSAISAAARAASQDAPGKIEAMAVSSAGEVALPVAGDGSALGPAIVSLDTRSVVQFEWLVDTIGLEKLTSFGGFEPRAHQTITRWLWLHEHEPELYRRARWLVGWMELVFLRLGLPPTVDRSLAVRSLGFDLREGAWDDAFLAELGLDRDKLPHVVASGTLVGRAQGPGCDDLGIPRSVAVVAGGLDQLCAAYGLGIERGSAAMLALGTTGVLAACVGPEEVDSSLPRVPFPTADTDLVIGGTPAGGALLRWFRDQLAGDARLLAAEDGKDAYDVLLAEVDDVRTPVLVIPHLGGSRVAFGDGEATGAITGLTFSTERVELVRALLDGVAYELAEMRDRFAGQGIAMPALIAAGGGSRSSAWMQIMADTMSLSVHSTASSDVGAYGAARLASSGYDGGELPSVEPIESYAPRAEWTRYHAARREAFGATFAGLQQARRAQRTAYDAGPVA